MLRACLRDVLARQFVAALLQHLLQDLSLLGAIQVIGIADVGPGRYFAKCSRYHFMPASSAHFLSPGSLNMVAATMPTAFSGPAGTMVEATEVDTTLIRNSGFQRSRRLS